MPYKNVEDQRAQTRKYYQANKDRIRSMNEAYRRANPQAHTARGRAWIDAHPEVKRAVRFANGANRRGRRWGSAGHLFGRDVILIQGPCAYCGGSQETWDHVVSLCNGGANDVANLVPSCHACNRRKGRWDRLHPVVVSPEHAQDVLDLLAPLPRPE